MVRVLKQIFNFNSKDFSIDFFFTRVLNLVGRGRHYLLVLLLDPVRGRAERATRGGRRGRAEGVGRERLGRENVPPGAHFLGGLSERGWRGPRAWRVEGPRGGRR